VLRWDCHLPLCIFVSYGGLDLHQLIGS
jgi:hypothetical protein